MVVFMISQKSDAWMFILVHQVLKVIPHLVIQLWRDPQHSNNDCLSAQLAASGEVITLFN